MPTLDSSWTFHGFDALLLENEHVRLVLLPELGGKIFQFRAKNPELDFLWNNHRVPPRRAFFGANFDNFFVGGWDHPFPTLEPSGEGVDALPYVGELWSLPWSWRQTDAVEPGAVAVEMAVEAVITPARIRCQIEVGEQPGFTMRYRIEHVGEVPFHFMWGLHPCLALEPNTSFNIPAGRATVIQSPDGGVGPEGHAYTWPQIDAFPPAFPLNVAPPPAAAVYGLHQLELSEGWFEVHRAAGSWLRIEFPVEVFPIAYLWMVYGGWRGIYHAAIEPWTSGGLSLDRAVASGLARQLEPGGVLEATVITRAGHGRGE